MSERRPFMLGVGIEVAFWKWLVTLRFHPLRWDRFDLYQNPVRIGVGTFGMARLGPFSLEWEVIG